MYKVEAAATREEWEQLRRTGIGGSDIAALVGLSPWRSSLAVYLEKVGEAPGGGDSAVKRRGRLLEAGVIAWFEEETGLKVLRHENQLLRDESNPIIIGSLDGEVPSTKSVFEAKTVHFSQARLWGPSMSDQIPDYYIVQAMWYMHLTRLDRCDVAVLFGGEDFRRYVIHYDKELAEKLVWIATDFWEKHVAPKVPPPLDNSEEAKRWLESKFPKEIGEFIPSTPEIESDIISLWMLKREMKEVEKEAERLENVIKAFIGSNAGVIGAWGKATWKEIEGRTTFSKEKAYDYIVSHFGKQFADRMMHEATTKSAPYRRFTLSIKE